MQAAASRPQSAPLLARDSRKDIPELASATVG
jgi:hypothetical protein